MRKLTEHEIAFTDLMFQCLDGYCPCRGDSFTWGSVFTLEELMEALRAHRREHGAQGDDG